MLGEGGFQFRLRQREELFEKNDGGAGVVAALPLPAQFVSDLAGAQDHALAIGYFVVLNYRLELAVRQITQRAGRIRMAQHSFRSEDDQGFPPGAQCLAAQHVEMLSGG